MTVTEVRDLRILLEDLDKNEGTVLLKAFLDKMKELMIETLETLKEALEKYNSAVNTFDNLNSSIATQNSKLEKMTNKNSAEHKAWTEKLRLGVYGTISGTTTGCIIADIFGALGICSTVNAAVSGISAAGIEAVIAAYGAAIEILTEEIDLINNWANSAEVVNKNIDKYPQQYLKKYRSIRTVFINGLDDLNNSAVQFLDQPVDILG